MHTLTCVCSVVATMFLHAMNKQIIMDKLI